MKPGVVWWWWCGVFFTDNNTTPTKVVLSWFGLSVGLWQLTGVGGIIRFVITLAGVEKCTYSCISGIQMLTLWSIG
jgi:hypothetical protein